MAGVFLSLGFTVMGLWAAESDLAKGPDTVSYYRQIRPVLQANCQGCHQPAKPKGGFIMTEFKKLLAGGDDEGAAIVVGHPDQSALLRMVLPKDGDIRMPKGKTPLSDGEVALLRRWIEQGAANDTPADAKPHYDAEHPPVYSQPPVVTSLDYSPDGALLAVAGFHEVLLYDPKGEKLQGRLVGLAERVQSLRFSPDGQWLAVAGGDPGRLGEIQVWEVSKRKLAQSALITFDTLYGVSWSPDSKLIAFGCADNTVRAIEAASGQQVLQMGSHSDWALSTAFSLKGDHIISGGRDMSVKLTEVATQRFVDNITSITPGALKGGVLAVAVHPTLEHIVTAGSDGLPKVYRIFRETKREIGDDAQFIGDLFPLNGRVFAARFSANGKRIACGSSLDGQGEVMICSYDFTNDVPKPLRDLMGKVPGARQPEEQRKLSDYRDSGIRLLARVAVPHSAVYALAFAPDGQTLATAGSDGKVRLMEVAGGKVVREFLSVPLTEDAAPKTAPAWTSISVQSPEPALPVETLPPGARAVALEMQPAQIHFGSRSDYAQLLVTARLESGTTLDVTRMVKFDLGSGVDQAGRLVTVSPRALCRPLAEGKGKLVASWGELKAEAPIEIAGLAQGYRADFIRDVGAILAKTGCNAGTCHGSKDGRNGFKLSLRGYDPETDVRALTDDLASRRVNLASPDDSLMLLKALAEVPHEGGRRMTADSPYYQTLRQWIVNGAALDRKSARATRIELSPRNPVVQQLGSKQQLRVLATFADGTERDVTAESFIESGNGEVAGSDGGGLITTWRRGEAAILARYQGNYTATTLTVMGDRTGFVWTDPPTWSRVDELVAAKWQRMKIRPSELCTDLDFLRRVYLDLTGLPPSTEEVRAFAADERDTRIKRDAVIDRLIGSPDYIDHWANKWADLLQCNAKYLGREGAESMRAWLREQVAKNTPYDQFVREIITASGSNQQNPAASYWKILRTPAEGMENTTHLFLATRFNCNKCHDHPFERWTQDQYYHLAAFFAQVSLTADSASAGKQIGGTEVEPGKPLYERVSDAKEGEIKHDRTGKVSPPEFPYPAKNDCPAGSSRREQLAAWITTPDNRYFASSYANRVWGYLLGVGIIEPLDDIRAGNPPANPELLEHLTREFVSSGFNARRLVEIICKSRTYQLSLRPNQWNEEDQVNYSHALARRLPAETLFDTVFRVTGATPDIPGAKPGQRAQELFDVSQDTGSGLLATLGRPARQSACECERSSELRLGAVMALLSGPVVSGAIDAPTNALARLVALHENNRKLTEEVFLRFLNRHASESEIEKTLGLFERVDRDHATLTNELAAWEHKLAPAIADLEQQRAAAVALAKKSIETYQLDTKFLREEVADRRQAGIAAANRELRDYERLLPAQAALWEAKNNPAGVKTVWTAIEPKELSASNGTKLARQPDGSILASGANRTSDYLLVADTALARVTGLMIEVLPDDRLPRFGPGRANDGNFVLSELELKYGVGTNAPEQTVKLVAAKADFSQTDFPVEQAIDGVVQGGANGWAVAGAGGVRSHTAAFKLERPLGNTNGLSLHIRLQQRYGDSFLVGRFRVYLTAGDDPLDFGLPQKVVEAVRAPAGERTPDQVAAIVDHFRAGDREFWRLKQSLRDADAPRPEDPRRAELERSLQAAEQPIKLDPYLVQLREDARFSAQQQANQRLTVVQDLAWALINSSSFLFNH